MIIRIPPRSDNFLGFISEPIVGPTKDKGDHNSHRVSVKEAHGARPFLEPAERLELHLSCLYPTLWRDAQFRLQSSIVLCKAAHPGLHGLPIFLCSLWSLQ